MGNNFLGGFSHWNKSPKLSSKIISSGGGSVFTNTTHFVSAGQHSRLEVDELKA